MKVISAGIQHESNTFCNDTTPIDDWIRDSECGDDLSGFDVVFDRFRDTNTIHGGYISGAEEVGVELVPVINCRAQPSGPISDPSESLLRPRFRRGTHSSVSRAAVGYRGQNRLALPRVLPRQG